MGKRGPKKGEGGRPKVWTDEAIEQLGEDLLEWAQQPQAFHLVNFVANHPNIALHTARIYEFAQENENFASILKRAQDMMLNNLSAAGYGGEVHATMAVFGLKQHGWRDKPPEQTKEENEGIAKLWEAVRRGE